MVVEKKRMRASENSTFFYSTHIYAGRQMNEITLKSSSSSYSPLSLLNIPTSPPSSLPFCSVPFCSVRGCLYVSSNSCLPACLPTCVYRLRVQWLLGVEIFWVLHTSCSCCMNTTTTGCCLIINTMLASLLVFACIHCLLHFNHTTTTSMPPKEQASINEPCMKQASCQKDQNMLASSKLDEIHL